jgi:hypothetical protein
MTIGSTGASGGPQEPDRPYGWNRPPTDPSPVLPRPPAMPPPAMGSRPVLVDPRLRPVQTSRVNAPASKSTAAPLIVLLAGAVMMIGSVTTWLTISFGGRSIGIAGTATSGGNGGLSSVNGWFTFTGGIILLLLGGLMFASNDRSLRQLATFISFASLAYAIYDLVRILNDISHYNSSISRIGLPSSVSTGVDVGFGLMLVLFAGLVALVASFITVQSS